MNTYSILQETAQKYAELKFGANNALTALIEEIFNGFNVNILNVDITTFKDTDDKTKIKAVIHYSIKDIGFGIEDLGNLLEKVNTDKWTEMGIDLEETGKTLTFGNNNGDRIFGYTTRAFWFTIVPIKEQEETLDDTVVEDDFAPVMENASDDVNITEDDDDKSITSSYYPLDDHLRKNIPNFLRILGTTQGVFNNGEIYVNLMRKYYTKKITKEDYLSYYDMDISDDDRENVLMLLIQEYLGDDIIDVMKQHPALLQEMNISLEMPQKEEETQADINENDYPDDSAEMKSVPDMNDEEETVQEQELEPEENLITVDWPYDYNNQYVTKEDYNREPCCSFPETYTPQWNCEVKDIKVIRSKYNINFYTLMAEINGNIYYTELKKEEVSQFLERNSDGTFTRRVTPEMLADYCMMNTIKTHSTYYDGLVLHKGKDVITTIGKEPVFTPDENFRLTGLLQKPLFGKTTVVEQNGVYCIETTINGVFRRAFLTEEDKKELLEKDAGGEYTRKVSPFTVMLRYFGHELQYLEQDCEPENQSVLRILTYNDHKQQPHNLLTMMPQVPQVQTTYEDAVPADYKVEANSIFFSRTGTYTLTVTIKKGYIKKMTNKWKKSRGETFNYTISDEDMANFLERDSEGKFTRRVSLEQLAYRYVLPHIRMHEDIIKMQKAGIPAAIMETVTGFSETELKNFLDDYSMKRNRWVPYGFIDKKKRDKIVQQYRNGSMLSELRNRNQFPDYSLLYSILKKEMDMEKPPLPKDLALSDKFDDYIF